MVREMTEEEFAAWLEWRKWCSVWRVKDPQPTKEELKSGMTDDKTPDERKRYYAYLYGYVSGCISKRLKRWYQVCKGNAQMYPGQDDELISVFDDYMKGDKKKISAGFTGRSYKDYIFYQISKSTDAPGNVLNGKIFGIKGYAGEILRRYLMETEQLARGSRGGVLLRPGTVSIDAPLDENGEQTLEDILYDNADGPEVQDETEGVMCLKAKLNLTREEKLALLAQACGVAVSNPKLCRALGCAKEKSKNILSAVRRRMRNDTPELWDLLRDTKNLGVLLLSIFDDLKAENENLSFLYRAGRQKKGD